MDTLVLADQQKLTSIYLVRTRKELPKGIGTDGEKERKREREGEGERERVSEWEKGTCVYSTLWWWWWWWWRKTYLPIRLTNPYRLSPLTAFASLSISIPFAYTPIFYPDPFCSFSRIYFICFHYKKNISLWFHFQKYFVGEKAIFFQCSLTKIQTKTSPKSSIITLTQIENSHGKNSHPVYKQYNPSHTLHDCEKYLRAMYLISSNQENNTISGSLWYSMMIWWDICLSIYLSEFIYIYQLIYLSSSLVLTDRYSGKMAWLYEPNRSLPVLWVLVSLKSIYLLTNKNSYCLYTTEPNTNCTSLQELYFDNALNIISPTE